MEFYKYIRPHYVLDLYTSNTATYLHGSFFPFARIHVPLTDLIKAYGTIFTLIY